ncbi:hypothetical protein [Psychrobacter alimentarius]|uniref:hypothetical protein n=1 Tax=Psychrobacter alimentarius TaxID=261164 RepID=UPI00191A8819|nr:hypothetical protein [Psychrobacter alimentarius]
MKIIVSAILATFLSASLVPVANAADGPNTKIFPKCSVYKVRDTSKTGKEAASDAPSWVKNGGYKPCKNPNEDGKTFADRAIRLHYNTDNYQKGAATEFNRIQKYGDRSFK